MSRMAQHVGALASVPISSLSLALSPFPPLFQVDWESVLEPSDFVISCDRVSVTVTPEELLRQEEEQQGQQDGAS